MRTSIWSGTCAAISLGFTVGLLAQQTPDTQSSAGQSMSAKSITVAGCIQRAEETPTGTSGAAGAASGAMATKFKLTNAAASPSATASTTGSPSSSATVASEYRLDAADAKLTPHVGHKVEITGTVEQPSSATSSSAASASAPKLKVDNVKMIAASCP